MARKARTRGEKVGPRQLTPRELGDVDRYLRAAGGWRQLSRQVKEWRKNRRPRGRPRYHSSDALANSILADGGPMLRRSQIRAKAKAFMELDWYTPLSEPVRATKPKRETPISPADARRRARTLEAFTLQIEKKLREKKRLKATLKRDLIRRTF